MVYLTSIGRSADIEALAVRMAGALPFLFIDYDGTLSEIAPRPELAVLAPSMKSRLAAVAAKCPVAVVSGRDLEDVRSLVGLPGLIYAGSHGLEIALPSGRLRLGEAHGAAIARAGAALRRALSPIDGALVQPKRYAVTVHTRLVDPAAKADVAASVRAVLSAEPTLRWMGGKEMHELRPAMPWDKGAAILRILDAEGAGGRYPVYIGDDITDEDAFTALEGCGTGILVGDHGAPTAADVRLPDVAAVEALLARLAELLPDRATPGAAV